MADPYPHFLPDIYAELRVCAAAAPLTPSKLRRFFLLMLRAHWSDSGNYGPDLEDSLACLEWAPDAKDFRVELQGSSIPEATTHAIWIGIGNIQGRQFAFGNRSNDFSEDNATEVFVEPCTIALKVRHEAPTLDTALDMGWSTFCFLIGFKDSIIDALGGEGASFQPRLVGEPDFKDPGPKKRFVVDVGAVLSVNVSVATTLESHRLKRIATVFTPTLSP